MNSSPIVPLTPPEQAEQQTAASHEGYFKRVLVAGDVMVNVIADGQPDETISSRASRAATRGNWFGRTLSRVLNRFQPNHGAKAQASDVERAEEVERIERQSGNVH